MSPELRLDAAHVGPRCLVTGGAGYIASYLIEALLELGCEVASLDVRPCPRWSNRPRVTHVIADIRDYPALEPHFEGVDTVFHTAALINLLGICRPGVRRRVFDVNVLGTEHVLRACRAHGVGRLVYTSSANVCVDPGGRDLVDVDESVGYADRFLDLYGESKAEAERLVLAANSEALGTIALRPGGVWGPGEGGVMIQTFVAQLAAGRFSAIVGDGRAVVDNTHVANLVDAELRAAAALSQRLERVGGQAYFVTDDERINGVEWFRPIVEALGYRYPKLHVPGRLIYGVAWALELSHLLGAPEPPVTRGGVIKLIRPSGFLIERARADLGYEPRVRQAEGLAAHMSDYRALHDRSLTTSR